MAALKGVLSRKNIAVEPRPLPWSVKSNETGANEYAYMSRILEIAGGIWRNLPALLLRRRDTSPIESVSGLESFVVTRAAFHGQKALYGYVKARMGIRYPAMFEDRNIVASLNLAKMQVFAACLSDLAIYAVAHAGNDRPIGNDERAALALRFYRTGLNENAGEAPPEFSAADAIAAFKQRLAATDWRKALTPENFTESPKAVFRWAPIAENLKKFDREIIGNSVKFAWRDIRELFGKRLNADAVYADWQAARQ